MKHKKNLASGVTAEDAEYRKDLSGTPRFRAFGTEGAETIQQAAPRPPTVRWIISASTSSSKLRGLCALRGYAIG